MPASCASHRSGDKEKVQTVGDAIMQWVLHWLEDPQHRLYAAQIAGLVPGILSHLIGSVPRNPPAFRC